MTLMHQAMVGRIAAVILLIVARAASAAPVAHTPLGDVAGIAEGKADAYLGIRYAAAPTGDLRWRSPQPVGPWTETLPATAFGHSCWQAVVPAGFGPWTHEYVTQGDISEDCLFLNVWTPAKATAKKLPVLVWIYGGGFNSGSGAIPIYDGRALAARGIVVVNLNYRVGVFGFLAQMGCSSGTTMYKSPPNERLCLASGCKHKLRF